MPKVLVAYTTSSGSTGEVAETVAEALRGCGSQVDLARLEEVQSVSGYGLVVVGAPMILGWHRKALGFLRAHRTALANTRLACFCTLMALTEAAADDLPAVPLVIDPWLPKAPRNPARLGLKERYATPANYLRPILQAAGAARPVSVALLGGKLELFRLPWWQMLFVMAVVQAQPGDRRNPAFIRQWAQQLT